MLMDAMVDAAVERLDANLERKQQNRYRRRMLFANLQSFAHRTSAHGLGRFFSQQIPWLRLLWCMVVLGAMTGLTLHTYKQIRIFRDYPVSSTTRLLTNRFTFPDVTFCDPLMKKFFTVESETLRHQSRSVNNYFAANYILAYNFANRQDNEHSARVKAIKIAYSTFEHAVHTWRTFNMTAASARIFDMLIYCQYNQESCSGDNFTVFYHRDYGNCFSFKANNRSIRSSGVEKGLVLVLYSPSVDIMQSIDYYSDTVTTGLETGGLRVAVHQQDTIPYPSEYGINSPSGMQTVLALSQVQTSLANTPTKRCDPKGKFYTYDHLFNETRYYEKQLADCTTFEHLKSVQEKCSCTIEGLVLAQSRKQPDVDYCHDLMGAQHSQQMLRLLDKFDTFFNSSPRLQQLFVRGGIRLSRFDAMNYTVRLQIARKLASEFPDLNQRVRRLQCALPFLKTGRKQSRCLNICKYTTYDFSVFQSRWPDPNFQIRGARIRLARIAGMLQQRINQINRQIRDMKTYYTTNHALNYSITFHDVNLTKCLDTQLNRSSNRFQNDTHCRIVHNIIKQSFLQLRVYPKTLTVRQLFEERSYELVNLFSDLGGIMGLWIGVSMVTLCEFAEIVLIVLSYYLRAGIRNMSSVFDQSPKRSPKAPVTTAGNHQQDGGLNPHRYQQPKFLGRRPLSPAAGGNVGPRNTWSDQQSPLLLPEGQEAREKSIGSHDAIASSRRSDQSEASLSPSNQKWHRRANHSPAGESNMCSIETRL